VYRLTTSHWLTRRRAIPFDDARCRGRVSLIHGTVLGQLHDNPQDIDGKYNQPSQEILEVSTANAKQLSLLCTYHRSIAASTFNLSQ
jgi:hypothetical protein